MLQEIPTLLLSSQAMFSPSLLPPLNLGSPPLLSLLPLPLPRNHHRTHASLSRMLVQLSISSRKKKLICSSPMFNKTRGAFKDTSRALDRLAPSKEPSLLQDMYSSRYRSRLARRSFSLRETSK